jgi:hypothetical protein
MGLIAGAMGDARHGIAEIAADIGGFATQHTDRPCIEGAG